jgi:drug/metabolite transporter (DMT)-like permease
MIETSAARPWRAALAAVGGSAMVGTMPLMARLLYADGVGAPSMLFWRFAIALLALAVIARLRGIDLRQAWRNGVWKVAALGATLGAAQALCFWESIKTLDTSIAEFLFYTYPAVTLLLDRAVFKMPIRPVAVFCIAVILLGAGLITGPGIKAGLIDARGLAWIVPAPLIYAAYLAINSRLLRRHPPLVGAGALFGGMLVTFGLTAVFGGLDVPLSMRAWWIVAFIGLGPGALWMLLFTFSVPRLGASSFAILANTEVITVVAIGTLVLGEPVTAARAAGGALILVGVVTRALTQRPATAGAGIERLRRDPHPDPPPLAGEGASKAASFLPPPQAGEGRGGGAWPS